MRMCLRKAAARRSSTTHWTPVLGPVLLRPLPDNDMQISNYLAREAQTGSTLRSVLNRRKVWVDAIAFKGRIVIGKEHGALHVEQLRHVVQSINPVRAQNS